MLKLLIKLIPAFLLLLVLIIVLGTTGASFYIWPTFFNDKNLDISDKTMTDISGLIEERKFDSSPSEFYFSTGNEALRLEAETQVNISIQEVVKTIQKTPKKSAVLFSIKHSLSNFEKYDSEEKDRALLYFKKLLDILKIESSNELFNV